MALNHSRAARVSRNAAIAWLACHFVFHPQLCAASTTNESAESFDRLTIIAPSAPGGGYDLTAQSMKRVLEAEGIASAVEVIRSPGAGGLIGLAQLLAAHVGDSHVLLIGGMVTLGASASNRSAISLLDATSIARVTGDYEVIVVPASSPYGTLDDLLEAMRAAPGTMRWVGGSAGGADEFLMWQLARAAGVDPHLMHYTAMPGGSEVIDQLISGQFVAGISGISELESLIDEGRLRALAISSPDRLAGVNIATLDELGVAGISLMNWRGVFAAPGISEDERNKLEAAVRGMVHSPSWRAALAQHHWQNAFLGGRAFAEFITAEQLRIAHSGPLSQEPLDPRILPSAMARRFGWALSLAAAALALTMTLWIQGARNHRREADLRRALQELSEDTARRASAMQGMLAGVSSQIEREFDRWGLSCAERSVAHLMLKGMRLKDIAQVRNTSSPTVRQQAQAIYRKARLDGRTDLAAYFLEDFLAPLDVRALPPRA